MRWFAVGRWIRRDTAFLSGVFTALCGLVIVVGTYIVDRKTKALGRSNDQPVKIFSGETLPRSGMAGQLAMDEETGHTLPLPLRSGILNGHHWPRLPVQAARVAQIRPAVHTTRPMVAATRAQEAARIRSDIC